MPPRSYHYHWCPKCKERWACGGAFTRSSGCPGFTTTPDGRPQQKAVDAPHHWHKIINH